jgi:hypothetical protein
MTLERQSASVEQRAQLTTCLVEVGLVDLDPIERQPCLVDAGGEESRYATFPVVEHDDDEKVSETVEIEAGSRVADPVRPSRRCGDSLGELLKCRRFHYGVPLDRLNSW